MADSYTSNYIHLIFVVRFRQSLIKPSWEDELYKYITGILTNRGHKLFAINGMPDHIHIFFDLNPVTALSDLARDLKTNSTKWINRKNMNRQKFQWQNGFAAFSYSRSQLSRVAGYIERQKEHHCRSDFKREYTWLLDRYEIDYRESQTLKSPLG
jgi:REP element-mobilizing transposase RayT